MCCMFSRIIAVTLCKGHINFINAHMIFLYVLALSIVREIIADYSWQLPTIFVDKLSK